MAKRIQNNDTTEQANPFLEEGSLEPETDESSFDDEDPLTKKKKKKAKKRAAPKKKAAAETDDDEAVELTQTDALADEDETPNEEIVAKPAKKTKVVAEKRTVLVPTTVETAPVEPVTPVATVAPVAEAPKLSAEDLMKTMTAAFEKTTTSLREIPVEIATSLEQARDEAEHRSSFVSKLTLGLSAAACVFSLLAVGLAQSTRHKQLVETAPAVTTTVARTARAERVERVERTEPKAEAPSALPQVRTPRVARTERRTETLAAARATTTRRTHSTTATTPTAATNAKTQQLNDSTEGERYASRSARTVKRTRRVQKDF